MTAYSKEAVEILSKSKKKFEFPVAFGKDLQSEHERYLTEEVFQKPVIIYNYPKTIKPFYMRLNDDNQTVAAMDVLVPRIGEIIGGSQREERLDILEARMDEINLSREEYWWYLDSRRFGSVPHSGFGLGFERLIMLGMNRRPVVLVLLLILTVIASTGLPHLEIDTGTDSLIPASDPARLVYERVSDEFGTDNRTIVYVRDSNLWSPKNWPHWKSYIMP